MRKGMMVLAMFLVLAPLGGCASTPTDPAHRPYVAEYADSLGTTYVRRPMLEDEDSVYVYTSEEELLANHPEATPACYFKDHADFLIRFSDVTRNSWEQERRYQFVGDRTKVAKETARLCGAEAVLLKESNELVRPTRVFDSQTGRVRWINGAERVNLEWYAWSSQPVPEPAKDAADADDGGNEEEDS